ncbi:hypothetical protein CHUAL_000546 [Chamberlinius hualienensis]
MAAAGGAGSTKGKSGKRSLAQTSTMVMDSSVDSPIKLSKSSSGHLVMDDGPPSKKKKVVDQTAKDAALAESKKEWPNEELTMLIDRLQMIMPKNDSIKFTTQMEKIDWDTVRFGDRTAIECKTKWAQIITKLRRYRTMTELVNDAKVWSKRPWTTFNNAKSKNKHPDLPKKPLTPYFRYFLEKRAKYSGEHPSMSMTELAKYLAKKFAELADKKKQKYKDSYERENEIYKQQMEKFKEEHPDMFNDDGRSGGNHLSGVSVGGAGSGSKSGPKIAGPPKPRTAMQLFLAEKMNKHTNLDLSDKKEYEDKYRQQWKNLSDNKRVKWIRKAISEEQRYTATLQQLCLDNPDFKLENVKSVISKAEKELLEKVEGKPEKPPNSGYSLYSKKMLKELKDIPSKEKMGEISRRWKELPEKERQQYTQEALNATEKYHKDYANYLASLPEDAVRRLEEEKNRKKKGSATVKAAPTPKPAAEFKSNNNNSSAKPKKPLSALFFYQQEKLGQYRANYPGKSEQELLRLIAREYGDLSDKKKDKYKKMADNAKKQPATPPTRETPSSKKSKLFRGEPKKPPQSGYLLYTTEIIAKLVDIEPKQRMVEISRRWRELSAQEQEKYKKRAADHLKKYNKDMAKFLTNLNKEDQHLYQQMKATKRGGAAAKSPVVKKNVKVEVVSEDEESEKDNREESSGESDSESDSSDDESDRSGSGSGSESKSDSDSSNSDSDNTKDGSSGRSDK